MNVSDWLQNLAVFTGQAFRRPSPNGLNLTAILQVPVLTCASCLAMLCTLL